MTFGIIPESDSKGRAVCQFWLQGGKHNVTPTDKKKITFRRESPWGPLDPPLFWEGRRPLSSPKERPRKTSIQMLTWLEGGDLDDIPCCHYGSCSL